jgi:hypothetical protein
MGMIDFTREYVSAMAAWWLVCVIYITPNFTVSWTAFVPPYGSEMTHYELSSLFTRFSLR